MAKNIVQAWLGDNFYQLAPELQQIHTKGGVLVGEIDVILGTGISKFIGQRLAKKLNIPGVGKMQLKVDICHDEQALYWRRVFNGTHQVESIFQPQGTQQHGYWLETTGPLTMKLTVDVVDSAWHWRCLGFKFLGVPLPVWLFPQSKAYKRIENGQYRFFVGFHAPLFGHLLSYSGLLQVQS